MTCKKCGAQSDPGMNFCVSCGEILSFQPQEINKFCEKCGTQFDPGMNFCSSCGSSRDKKPSVQTNQYASTAQNDFAQPTRHTNKQQSQKVNNKKVGIIACAVVLLVVVIGAIIIISPDGRRDRDLVGIWESEWKYLDTSITSRYEFRRNGRGTYSFEFVSGNDMSEEEGELTWKTNEEGRLSMQFVGTDSDMIWYSYKIVGDTMRLIYGEGSYEDADLFKRVK